MVSREVCSQERYDLEVCGLSRETGSLSRVISKRSGLMEEGLGLLYYEPWSLKSWVISEERVYYQVYGHGLSKRGVVSQERYIYYLKSCGVS